MLITKGKTYLLAVDLEGVHGVVGEPYKGLSEDVFDYHVAVENATKELNVAIKALFDCGAETVAVWDNHGSGKNLDFSKLDSRVVRVENTPQKRYKRMGFAENFSFDGVLFFGYHAKAGSEKGILAHTYSSQKIQYYKLNGKQVGEIEIDAYVAASYSIPALLVVSDDVCVAQAREMSADIYTVITKYGKGRNEAEFIPEEVVLESIYKEVCACVCSNIKPICLSFPCVEEVRYTRAEDAEKILKKIRNYGQCIEYGEDCHTLVSMLQSIDELIF